MLPAVLWSDQTFAARREGVILRAQAAKKRKAAADDEGQYLARSEVNKPKLIDLIKVSSLRPICEYPDAVRVSWQLLIRDPRASHD